MMDYVRVVDVKTELTAQLKSPAIHRPVHLVNWVKHESTRQENAAENVKELDVLLEIWFTRMDRRSPVAGNVLPECVLTMMIIT